MSKGESACICVDKDPGCGPNAIYSYPTPGKDGSVKELIDKHGYLVIRGFISQAEVERTLAEISSIIRDWYAEFQRAGGRDGKDWETLVNRMPAWKNGEMEPPEPELGVRRLFRVAVENEYFANLCRHEKILSIVTEVLGPNVKLLQSLSLLKPPGGQMKTWHQDNAYFRLTPPNVLGVWIALDPTNCSNGCMHVLPNSHGRGLYKHDAATQFHIDYGMVDLPNPNDVVSVILEPGDALVFSGETAHYTPPNVSTNRRRSVQFHYAASDCQPTRCPRSEQEEAEIAQRAQRPQGEDKPHYFDCDPSCVEPSYWYFRKGELLVAGKDFGGHYI